MDSATSLHLRISASPAGPKATARQRRAEPGNQQPKVSTSHQSAPPGDSRTVFLGGAYFLTSRPSFSLPKTLFPIYLFAKSYSSSGSSFYFLLNTYWVAGTILRNIYMN